MTPQTPSALKVLYISGPFSHPDPVHGIPKNILLASEAALDAGQEYVQRTYHSSPEE